MWRLFHIPDDQSSSLQKFTSLRDVSLFYGQQKKLKCKKLIKIGTTAWLGIGGHWMCKCIQVFNLNTLRRPLLMSSISKTVILKNESEINSVIESFDCGKRKRKDFVTPEYFNKRKKQANLLINKWITDDVPTNVYQWMEYVKSPLIRKYALTQIRLNEVTSLPATFEPTVWLHARIFYKILH